MQLVQYHDLTKIKYKNAWDYQRNLQQKLLHKKLNISEKSQQSVLHHLLICEHNPVYTLGKSGDISNLIIDQRQMQTDGLEFFEINRGGDITFHGPGQLTIYPIFDLECFYEDVHKYVRNLEEVVIRTLASFNIVGVRNKGFTGVWIEDSIRSEKRKICALGVHISRWVSLHGLGFNVNTELKYFENMIPCGINEDGRSVTSMEKELGKKMDLGKVKEELLKNFITIFNLEILEL